MMSKIVALVALFGAAVAAPVRIGRGDIAGQLAGGAGFAAGGHKAAGAASDGHSGIAGGSADEGAVLGAASPKGALAGAFGSGFFGGGATPSF